MNKDEEIRIMALDQKAKMTKKKEEKLRLNQQFRKLQYTKLCMDLTMKIITPILRL